MTYSGESESKRRLEADESKIEQLKGEVDRPTERATPNGVTGLHQ